MPHEGTKLPRSGLVQQLVQADAASRHGLTQALSIQRRAFVGMDWLPALLKHLAIARSGVVAAFVTASVVHFGPRLAPAHIEALGAPWSSLALVVLVFTGALLAFWVAEAVAAPAAAAIRSMIHTVRSRRITDDEAKVIYAMGKDALEPLNLDSIDWSRSSLSRLEMLDITDSLIRKGYVSANPFAHRLLTLTDRGRKRALTIERALKEHAARSRTADG